MNTRLAYGVEIGTVALLTVLGGVVLLTWNDWGSGATLSLIAIGLGFVGASLTAFFSARRASLEERERIQASWVSQEKEYVAYSRAHDYLTVLQSAVREEAYRDAYDPPDIVLSALMAIRSCTLFLASLGQTDLAIEIDEEVRELLESHGKATWLWTFARFHDPEADGHDRPDGDRAPGADG